MDFDAVDQLRNSRQETLPIDQYKRFILYGLEQHQVLLVVGEAGSGKTTRIPQFLISAGIYNDLYQVHDNAATATTTTQRRRQICISQPRRVAAIQLAQRVADDLRCNVGSLVGYAVRFKDATNDKETLIKFITDGLLLREIFSDPLLSKYSVIIIDEAHERNINTDILLGLLKCILLKRKDLRVIICSATLQLDSFIGFFNIDKNSGAIIQVSGTTHPVDFYYLDKPVANYLDTSVKTAIQIHETARLSSGKILIFLTGQDEVEYVCDKLIEYSQTLSTRLDLKKLCVLPLHATLSPAEIAKVFENYSRNTRVCVVSTNVAETSLTINGIAYVIDCGFAKLKVFDHRSGINSLIRVPISKSSAKQRAGRAGRTRDGKVYRLYTQKQFNQLELNTVPEIQRSCLAETVMLLKSLGVNNLNRFPLVSPIPHNNLVGAYELLHSLKAVDDYGNLTLQGRQMSKFSLDPRLSKLLVSPDTRHCTSELCKIVAMLQVKEVFIKSNKYCSDIWTNSGLKSICSSEGDLISYLNIYNSFINNQRSQKWAERKNLNYQAILNATEIAVKLENQLNRLGIDILSSGRVELIQKGLVSGLFSNAAYLHPSGEYRTIRGDKNVHIHPTSVLSELVELPKFVIFFEVLNTAKVYMRHITSIEQDWLLDAAPHFYTFATSLEMMRA